MTALLTALALLFSSCGSGAAAGVNKLGDVVSRNTIGKSAKAAVGNHYSSGKTAFIDSGISSGFIELWLDKKTNSFGIYDNSADTLWTALPLRTDYSVMDENTDTPSMVTLKITGGTDIYQLNSQDNSVAYGKASIKESKNGCVFSYDIFDSESTADKKTYDKTDIGFHIDLTITLEDGSMSVGCKWKNITGNTAAHIEKIETLNYFGAYNDTAQGDFLFVPDGCGAKINTAVYDESFESLTFAVYGDDLSNPSEYDGSATVPAFGIKRGDAAVAALIEYGDAVASISADKATSAYSYNRVYPSFCVTPVAYSDNTLYISKNSAIDSVKLCYRFLSGVNATYAGMASAVREQLIRDGVLSTQTAEKTDDIPFFLTLTGVGKKAVGSLGYDYVLTDFEQAQDMLIRMKNKGINNVNVRYTAAKTGGSDSEDVKNTSYLGKLGGSSGFKKLYDYMSGQNMGLYADVDILSSSKSLSGGEAVDIKGGKSTYKPENLLITAMGTELGERTLRRLSDLKDTISSVLADTRDTDFSGLCLNDAGSILYSDFSQDGILRQEASDTISGTVSPLSTEHGIMIVNGNFYMLKNVDSVIELPLSTNVAKSGAYTPVPFVQLILHGLADYSGEPINVQANQEETLLRYIEFGACPHYKWNYTPISGDGESDIYYYDNTINSAAEFYVRANNALSDLRNARMTDHYEEAEGVFCTEYDTGAMIYVNYTSRDYTVRGVVVGAGDFLRIN